MRWDGPARQSLGQPGGPYGLSPERALVTPRAWGCRTWMCMVEFDPGSFSGRSACAVGSAVGSAASWPCVCCPEHRQLVCSGQLLGGRKQDSSHFTNGETEAQQGAVWFQSSHYYQHTLWPRSQILGATGLPEFDWPWARPEPRPPPGGPSSWPVSAMMAARLLLSRS